MQSRLLLTATLLALLAGCASQPAERPGAQACNATRLAHLVGRMPDEATLEKARQQANAEQGAEPGADTMHGDMPLSDAGLWPGLGATPQPRHGFLNDSG